MLTWILGYSGVSPGESVLVSSGACKCTSLPSCSSSVTLPFAWKKGSVAFPRGFPTRLSKEAFPRGFPTGLSKMSQWCESILGLKSRQCRENRFPWNGLRHLGDSGQGSCLSSYKAETGLLWMWAGPSCFLSIGNGYVGEVLELQQGCEEPFGNSRV